MAPKKPRHYLSRTQVAERIGVAPDALSRYDLPPPSVVIGPVNDDGTIPRGSVRGWSADDIDTWDAGRVKRPARRR